MKPVCFGNHYHVTHVAACRATRPLCRWRRKALGVCVCVAYHFPHRHGSGRCIEGKKGQAAYQAWLETPRRRVA